MSLSVVLSILLIRQSLYTRVEERVEGSLAQEVEEFRRLAGGQDPATGQPFGDDVTAIFNVFLSRNVPNDDEFFLALLNGRFYSSSPRALPELIRPNSKLVKGWTQLTQPEQGKQVTSAGTLLYIVEPVRIVYRAEPIRTKEAKRAVFVVVHTTVGEREEVNEAITVVIQVTLVVLTAASILAWIAAGRVLAPLRILTETARSITESDLTRRIPVKSSDEIAELATTFNEMLDRLQSSFSSQRNFLDDVGHELRTPITIVRGHLELLSDDPEEQRETVELVTDELDRMSRFVEDLLLLAKTEQPNFLTLETLEIGLLMEELYAKAKALASRDWRLEDRGSGRIVADRQRITQAIMNLAQNATQHTTEGDVIAFGSELTNNNVSFWVRDTGAGVSLSDQKQIFERFARGSSGHRSEGAGLGLSIVHAIAEAHGGRVELRSQPGIGSTFTLVLPLKSLP